MTRGSAGRWRTRMGNRARSRSPPVGGHLLFGERDVESAKVVLASGRRRYVNDRGADAGRSSVGAAPRNDSDLSRSRTGRSGGIANLRAALAAYRGDAGLPRLSKGSRR